MAQPIGRVKPAEHLVELRALVIDYAKQETIGPLGLLKAYLSYGVAGAVLIGVGGIYLCLGFLRMLQSLPSFEGDTGALSLVPYGATIVLAVFLITLAVLFGRKRANQKRNRS